MDLFELSATLRLDTSEYERAISKAEKMASDLDKKLGKAGGFSGASVGSGSGIIGRIGSGLGKLASIGTKAFSGMANVGMKSMSMLAKGGQVAFSGLTKGIGMVTKAATIGMGSVAALGAAFAPMVKGAVSAFSSYEQLVGGVETLFKDSAGFVLHDANEAFKTAGMSANQYMENVTSFAASMIQGLGGDTMKAAEMSNMAITDMADNVNKMGTSMESVEYAYRGFSKQNYTMLDNLKLGYGGTREEMERLLSDAEKLTGKKYDISNFADVVDAIHAIQVEMGITGTTAKEAETTIQGSASRMKASWQNVLTVLANPRGIKNLKAVAQEFGESLTVYISNLAPSIKAAVMGLPTLITELSPVIEEQIPNLISDIIPTIINSGIDLGIALVKGITKTLKKIDFGKIFKTAGSKIKTVATDWLGLPSDASISEIFIGLGTKIREEVVKLKNKAKLKLAELLGLTNANGSPITDADMIPWGRIGESVAGHMKNILSGAKLTLAALLGLKNEDGTDITNADGIDWATIADSVFGHMQTVLSTAKITLAALLGLDDPKNATLGETLNKLVQSALKGIKSGGDFLKRLLIGDDAYKAIQTQIWKDSHKGGNWYKAWNDGTIDAVNVGWDKVVGRVFDNFEGGFDSLFTDGIPIVLDIAGGIAQFVVELAKEIEAHASDIAKGIVGALKIAAESLPEILGAIAGTIEEILKDPSLPNGLTSFVSALIHLIIEEAPKLASAFGEFLDNLFKNLGADTDFKTVFSSLMDSIVKLADAVMKLFFEEDQNGNMKMRPWLETTLGAISDVLTFIGDVVAAIAEGLDSLPRATQSTRAAYIAEFGWNLGNKYYEENQKYNPGTGFGTTTAKEWRNRLQNSDVYRAVDYRFAPEAEKKKRAQDTTAYNAEKTAEKVMEVGGDIEEFNKALALLAEAFPKGTQEIEIAGRKWTNAIPKYYEENGKYYREISLPNADGKITVTVQEFDDITAAIASLYQFLTSSGYGNRVPGYYGPYKFEDNTQNKNAKGAWSVPYDGYIAMLHRNERVLTASQARQSDYGGGNADVVAAIQSLKNDLQNLKLVVGQKIFGSAVVDYGGKRMNNYIGKAEDKMVAGYGWG